MQIASKHLMNCFHVSGSRVAVLSSHRIQFSSSSRPEWILREFTWNHFASYSQPSQAFFNIGYLRASQVFLSLSSPCWYLMNWCAADVTDDKKEREIALLWQHCGVNITCFFFFLHHIFSFTSPSHLLHSVCTSCSLFAPFSLPHPSLSDFHSVLSPGGVRAGLLCPLWVGRVFKLYCSRQAWGKPMVVVDWVRRNEHVWSHKEKYYASVRYVYVL